MPSSEYLKPAAKRCLYRAKAYVDRFPMDPIPIRSLAMLAEFSPFHFVRAFRTSYGSSPHAYLIRKRAEIACELLHKGYSVQVTARLSGFADSSHLTRHFKRLYGVPPGHYTASESRTLRQTSWD